MHTVPSFKNYATYVILKGLVHRKPRFPTRNETSCLTVPIQ